MEGNPLWFPVGMVNSSYCSGWFLSAHTSFSSIKCKLFWNYIQFDCLSLTCWVWSILTNLSIRVIKERDINVYTTMCVVHLLLKVLEILTELNTLKTETRLFFCMYMGPKIQRNPILFSDHANESRIQNLWLWIITFHGLNIFETRSI